jgi:tetrahydromethanopterin S-methyltransferase subunit A
MKRIFNWIFFTWNGGYFTGAVLGFLIGVLVVLFLSNILQP